MRSPPHLRVAGHLRPACTSARCICTRTTQERFGLTRGMFPVAEHVSDRVMSLPLWGGMPDDQAWTVVDAMRRAILGKAR